MVDEEHDLFMGNAALSAGDFVHRVIEAADLIINGIEKSINNKTVTYDFHRLMKDAEKVSCSGFGKAIIDNM